MKYTSSASSASSTLSSSSSVLPQVFVIEKFFGKWDIMMEIPKANFKWSSCEGGFQVGKKYFLDTFYSCQIYQPPQRELSFVASESPTPSSGWAPAMSGALKVVTISSFWKIHCFRKPNIRLRAWGLKLWLEPTLWSRYWKWSQVLLSSFWASRNSELTT